MFAPLSEGIIYGHIGRGSQVPLDRFECPKYLCRIGCSMRTSSSAIKGSWGQLLAYLPTYGLILTSCILTYPNKHDSRDNE